MEKRKKILRLLSYILVAALASCVTFFLVIFSELTKLEELEALILTSYVGGADKTQLEDAAAAGMVAGTGDKWSYYIPAAD